MKEFWNELTLVQKVKYILSAIAFILVTIFAVLNWKPTEVHLLFTRVLISKTLLIVISIAGGIGISTLFSFRKLRKKDKEIKQLKSQLNPSNTTADEAVVEEESNS